jgi:hypothetical protein
VVARPDGVGPEQRPAGIERSGVVAVVDTASRHATASVAGVHPSGVHPSGFGVRDPGCPAVRCPVTWGRRPEVRRSAVCCPPVQCPAVRCPAVWCPAVRPDASVSSHAQVVALGTRSRWPGDPDHRNRWRPLRLPGRRRLDRMVQEAGTRATLPKSGWSVGGRWWTPAAGLVGPRRPRLPLSDQAGPAGVRRAVAGGGAVGTGARLQREVAAPAAWLASSGWVRGHGGWSSPSLTPGWADPEGPLEGPAGMGVRPQRGPSGAASAPSSVPAAL